MRLPARLLGSLVLAAALGLPPPAAGQTATRFGVHVDEGDGRPVVEAVGLLEDDALRTALESGLPLRFRLRVELWRKAFFDQLMDSEEINLALLFDPLDRQYVLEDDLRAVRYPTAAEAQDAVENALRPRLRPERRGRFYYLASLQVETLSLSDLQELRRWLRGEVRPAVEGRGSPARAVETGLRRVLIRVMGLPTRNFETRSATFIVP